MPLEFSTSMVEVTQKIFDLLEDAQEELGLAAVYYGRTIAPEFPVAYVESGPKARTIVGTHRYGLNLSVFILLEHGALQSITVTKKQSEEFAEQVESKLHEDRELHRPDGTRMVINSYVTAIDPGIVRRQDVLIRATRLTWDGISREEF